MIDGLVMMMAMVYPSGRLVRYELDALSRVDRITTQATAASPVKVVGEAFNIISSSIRRSIETT